MNGNRPHHPMAQIVQQHVTQCSPQLSEDNISWGTSCLKISQEQLALSASSASRQQ